MTIAVMDMAVLAGEVTRVTDMEALAGVVTRAMAMGRRVGVVTRVVMVHPVTAIRATEAATHKAIQHRARSSNRKDVSDNSHNDTGVHS